MFLSHKQPPVGEPRPTASCMWSLSSRTGIAILVFISLLFGGSRYIGFNLANRGRIHPTTLDLQERVGELEQSLADSNTQLEASKAESVAVKASLESELGDAKVALKALQQTADAGSTELAAAVGKVGELEGSLGESNAQLEASKAESEAVKASLEVELGSAKVALEALQQTADAGSTELAAAVTTVSKLEQSLADNTTQLEASKHRTQKETGRQRWYTRSSIGVAEGIRTAAAKQCSVDTC